ncbi:hypothetical protein [Microvirga puerhi]|uniref:Uncharacterized protein n=1 Tax=Microvirga puerhi TaxID=2876078 RepID=A0ABS7VV39_9HYPH|nr:hypothetical protein [Microvirga puerhi]MBZ6078915.1 hypothetical protein [Microvirga puerhi]
MDIPAPQVLWNSRIDRDFPAAYHVREQTRADECHNSAFVLLLDFPLFVQKASDVTFAVFGGLRGSLYSPMPMDCPISFGAFHGSDKRFL